MAEHLNHNPNTERKVDSRFSDKELERFRQDFCRYIAEQRAQMQELTECNKRNAETIAQLREETDRKSVV